jgi:23S rRNA (uridine2552-2'-O)-methyltransferase
MPTKREQDAFGHRAKREGYPARSVYKLEEIDKRVRLFRRGQRVLDLGAAPGSWTLYAAQKVGLEGRVVAIDLNPIEVSLPANVQCVQGDLREIDVAALGGPAQFDLVISDMAPHTSGQRHADAFRSYELVMLALEIAQKYLATGGHFVAKIFQGAEFEEARKAMNGKFDKVRVIKPEASRQESYEIFLVGLGRKGAPTSG